MMMGECPYDDCKHFEMRAMPDQTGLLPAFNKETCEGCKRIVWAYYSRLDPKVYTEEGFHAEWILDEETKSVRERNQQFAAEESAK